MKSYQEFPYKVSMKGSDTRRPEWCREKFGAINVKWDHHLDSKHSIMYHFKEEADLMMFILRWV